MQAANCYYNFSCVQHGSLLIEFLIFSQIGKQFSAIQEIYYKVQFSLSLESKMKLNNIRIFDFFKNISFCLGFYK